MPVMHVHEPGNPAERYKSRTDETVIGLLLELRVNRCGHAKVLARDRVTGKGDGVRTDNSNGFAQA
jgi:hypothetical protein